MIRVEYAAAAAVVYVEGEVDLACREEFRSALVTARSGARARTIVSFLRCPFIDVTGVGALVGARDAAVRMNVVVPPASYVARILSILELGDYLGLVPTLEAAYAAPDTAAAV